MRSAVLPLDICQLEEADAAALRRLWAQSKGAEPPKTFTARLMRLALARDAQTAREGGEAAQARREWNQNIRGRCSAGANKRRGITF